MCMRTILPKPSVLTYSLTSSVDATMKYLQQIDSRPVVFAIGQKTPYSRNYINPVVIPATKKIARTVRCKKAKRPVVELFAPGTVNPNRSYSRIFTPNISTDESRKHRIAACMALEPASIAPAKRGNAGFSVLHSSRSSVENSVMNASTQVQDKSEKISELESDLDPDYVPSDDEPFMSEKQLRFFELQLLKWRKEILDESRGTLNQLQDGPIREPDLNDRASSETDWGIELRTRDRQRKLIAKDRCRTAPDQGRRIWLLPGNRRTHLARPPARPPDRHNDAGGAGTPRAPGTHLTRRLIRVTASFVFKDAVSILISDDLHLLTARKRSVAG
jgi:DnaK suppressor protein